MKKRIIIAVPDMAMGGITTAAINLANELCRRGHAVALLNMGNKEENEKQLGLEPDIAIIHLNGMMKYWELGMEMLLKQKNIFPKFFLLLLAVVKKTTNRSGLWLKIIFSGKSPLPDYDVAIAFRQCAPCYYFVLEKINAQVKLAYVHGELQYMGDISSWRKYMPRFSGVAYVSNAVKRQFVAQYPELKDNACVIHNMFDITRIHQQAASVCTVEFDPQKKNIVTVARIDNSFKQIDWIPLICKKLKERTSVPFHWYIVGDGPDYDTVAQMIKDYSVTDVLSLLGEQKNPFPFLKKADFSVLTSKSEAYPMVIMESLILQKPVISTNFEAITEMIIDGKQGAIAEMNVEALTDRIVEMLEDQGGILSKCTGFLSKNAVTNEEALDQLSDIVGRI